MDKYIIIKINNNTFTCNVNDIKDTKLYNYINDNDDIKIIKFKYDVNLKKRYIIDYYIYENIVYNKINYNNIDIIDLYRLLGVYKIRSYKKMDVINILRYINKEIYILKNNKNESINLKYIIYIFKIIKCLYYINIINKFNFNIIDFSINLNIINILYNIDDMSLIYIYKLILNKIRYTSTDIDIINKKIDIYPNMNLKNIVRYGYPFQPSLYNNLNVTKLKNYNRSITGLEIDYYDDINNQENTIHENHISDNIHNDNLIILLAYFNKCDINNIELHHSINTDYVNMLFIKIILLNFINCNHNICILYIIDIYHLLIYILHIYINNFINNNKLYHNHIYDIFHINLGYYKYLVISKIINNSNLYKNIIDIIYYNINIIYYIL